MWGPMGQSKDWILQMSHTARWRNWVRTQSHASTHSLSMWPQEVLLEPGADLE